MISERKRIAALEAENASLCKDNADLREMLRGFDQDIFDISQLPSWKHMRPKFAALCEKVNVRMKAESNRISDLLTSELRKTYGKCPSPPKASNSPNSSTTSASRKTRPTSLPT